MDSVIEALRLAQREHEQEVARLKQAADTAADVASRASMAANEAEAECARLRAALATARGYLAAYYEHSDTGPCHKVGHPPWCQEHAFEMNDRCSSELVRDFLRDTEGGSDGAA